MAWNEETQERVKARLIEAFGNRVPACPLCGNNRWGLEAGFATVPFDPEPSKILSSLILPAAAFVCKTCGNTHLINLITIGLADILDEELEALEEAPDVVVDGDSADD